MGRRSVWLSLGFVLIAGCAQLQTKVPEDVEFDGEAELRPVAVELVALNSVVGVRPRKARLQNELQEPPLEA